MNTQIAVPQSLDQRIALLDSMSMALTTMVSIEEVKDLRDKAQVILSYTKKQRDESGEIQNSAAALKLRAERRIGELLKETPKNEGSRSQLTSRGVIGGCTTQPPITKPPKLADLGIEKTLAHRCQKIADAPAEVFENYLETTPQKGGEITTAGFLKLQKEAVRAEKHAEKEREVTSRLEMVETVPISDRYAVHCCAVSELADLIQPGSVDVIITDPPYPEEHLPLYEQLAEFAAHALKPGGSLLAMCGQSYLPKIYEMVGRHLQYHWTLSYLTPGGQSVQQWDRKVNTFWKPVLWFTNGDYSGEWHGDVLKSAVNDNDKRHHEWGQSESGFTDIVEKFTMPGDTICDPFLGGGTTAVVALRLGRRFLGADIDEECIKKACERLSKEVIRAK